MKKSLILALVALFLAALLFGCEKEECPMLPEPPYGNPETSKHFYKSDGWELVDYIYPCENGEQLTVQFIRRAECKPWMQSEIINSCN
jgi:hypothetical protein